MCDGGFTYWHLHPTQKSTEKKLTTETEDCSSGLTVVRRRRKRGLLLQTDCRPAPATAEAVLTRGRILLMHLPLHRSYLFPRLDLSARPRTNRSLVFGDQRREVENCSLRIVMGCHGVHPTGRLRTWPATDRWRQTTAAAWIDDMNLGAPLPSRNWKNAS